MTHIVTDNCTSCRFTDCVSHCPVECFHADDQRLYIDPNVCIDCSACIEACPVGAIYDAVDMPEALNFWIAINEQKSAVLPVIRDKQEPLPTAAARREALGL